MPNPEDNSLHGFQINFKPRRQALYMYKYNNKYLRKKKERPLT